MLHFAISSRIGFVTSLNSATMVTGKSISSELLHTWIFRKADVDSIRRNGNVKQHQMNTPQVYCCLLSM